MQASDLRKRLRKQNLYKIGLLWRWHSMGSTDDITTNVIIVHPVRKPRKSILWISAMVRTLKCCPIILDFRIPSKNVEMLPHYTGLWDTICKIYYSCMAIKLLPESSALEEEIMVRKAAFYFSNYHLKLANNLCKKKKSFSFSQYTK